MKLWLLRHASAEAQAASGRDEDRRLNRAGRRSCEALNEWIQANVPHRPGTVLVSPAQRTLETAQSALAGLGFPQPVTDAALWNASPGDLAHLIDDNPGTEQDLMLIGHNPGLEGVARWLGARLPITGMRPATLVILELAQPLTPGSASTLACFQPSESI